MAKQQPFNLPARLVNAVAHWYPECKLVTKEDWLDFINENSGHIPNVGVTIERKAREILASSS